MDELFNHMLDAFLELIEEGEQIPDIVFDTVTQLIQNRIAVGPQPNPDLNIQQAQYPSSNVFGFNYDKDSKNLLIKFMGKETAESGPIYKYSGVPNYIFEVLKRGAVAPRTTGKNKYHAWFKGRSPSHGASVYALIREAGFPYQKVA